MPKIILDAYTIKARLSPFFITILPLPLAIIVWYSQESLAIDALISFASISGLTLLFSQIGRDLGKKKEKRLFESWGGAPTIQILRHKTAGNPIILERYHTILERSIPNIKLPSPEEESADPSLADNIYETCIVFLREKTRDKLKFNILFDENISYGFRRNLWALKPLGLLCSLIGIVSNLTFMILSRYNMNLVISSSIIGYALLCFILLLFWIFWFNEKWVKLAALAYAERLLACCENL